MLRSQRRWIAGATLAIAVLVSAIAARHFAYHGWDPAHYGFIVTDISEDPLSSSVYLGPNVVGDPPLVLGRAGKPRKVPILSQHYLSFAEANHPMLSEPPEFYRQRTKRISWFPGPTILRQSISERDWRQLAQDSWPPSDAFVEQKLNLPPGTN